MASASVSRGAGVNGSPAVVKCNGRRGQDKVNKMTNDIVSKNQLKHRFLLSP